MEPLPPLRRQEPFPSSAGCLFRRGTGSSADACIPQHHGWHANAATHYPILKEELEKRGLYSEGLMRRIAQEGAVSHIKELPEDIRRVFVSTHDISPEYHVRMQAAFQRHTDNAVSKTVNFSNEATREDVAKVYSLAFTLGCKGVTIYRDGSRDEQVLNIGKVKRADQAEEARHITPRPRPDVVTGVTERVKIGCGNLYITVNYDEQGICEIFTNTGKQAGVQARARLRPD